MEKYTVSEFTQIISEVIDEAVPTAWVEGEVSGMKRYPSGHCYFTIKDENSSISAVIWGTYANKMPRLPKEGEKSLFLGKAKVFEKRGQYQFTVFNFTNFGEGNINRDFESLKKKLLDEGLFDAHYKKNIPKIPSTVAIVTGKDSAALSDVLKVLQNKAPYVHVKIFPTVVQGENNDVKVINTLKKVEQYSKNISKIDCVLLVRGGGSVEDLWLFNSEKLVRFIFNFSLPLISGIGHDVDFTLTDFVADLRASTPSVAAEKCALDIENIWATIDYYDESISRSLHLKLNNFRTSCENLIHRISTNVVSHGIDTIKLRQNNSLKVIEQRLNYSLEKLINRHSLATHIIENLNPSSIYKLGFAQITEQKNRKMIKSVKNVQINDHIKVILQDGEFTAKVVDI